MCSLIHLILVCYLELVSKHNLFLCWQITFVGEGAVDLGGPRREFFRLLACEAAESPYFCGGILGKFFACNVPAVKCEASKY